MYLFCKSVKQTAKLDFDECIRTHFIDQNQPLDSNINKPRILFSLFYSHVDSNRRVEDIFKRNVNIPANLHIVGASKVELDFDFHVEQAEKIFRKICPSEEFLPKPPEQEDIIFDSSEASSVNETEKNKDSKTEECQINQTTNPSGQESQMLAEEKI